MKRIVILVLAALTFAACADGPTQPAEEVPSTVALPTFSTEGTNLYPVVIVRSGRGASHVDGAPVVAELADALPLVASGGKILVLPGTHTAERVLINKPITIQGIGLPTLDAGGADYNLAVDFATDGAAPSGAVVIRGLRFVNALSSNLWVSTSYDTVLVEECEFRPDETGDAEPFEGRFYSAGIAVFATGRGVTVRNSRFLEGAIGVIGERDIRVESSYFTGQSNAAVHGGDIDVVGNTVDGCGGHEWCLFLASFGDPIHLEVHDNRIETRRQVHNPIVVIGGGGTATITGNVVRGTDPAGHPLDPHDPEVLQGSGIDLSSLASVDVSGNTITNLYQGVMFGNAVTTATGSDNVIDNVVSGLMSFAGPNFVFRRNDITNYERAANVLNRHADLTCNWWGSADGPVNLGTPSRTVYTPWATAPIAGTGATTCDGGV